MKLLRYAVDKLPVLPRKRSFISIKLAERLRTRSLEDLYSEISKPRAETDFGSALRIRDGPSLVERQYLIHLEYELSLLWRHGTKSRDNSGVHVG